MYHAIIKVITPDYQYTKVMADSEAETPEGVMARAREYAENRWPENEMRRHIFMSNIKVEQAPMKEQADYDYDHHAYDEHQLRMDGYADLKDKPNIKNRKVPARYADNPILMHENEAAENTQLDQIQKMLNDANIDDDEIRRGVELRPRGYQLIAAKLGVEARQARTLINSLIEKLRKAHQAMEEDYHSDGATVDQYSYETDFMGNVTIRDKESGKSCFLQGSDGADFLDQIDQTDDPNAQQHIMSEYSTIMEGANALTEDDSYNGEIRNDTGSYNFPWSMNGIHGTGTAVYSGEAKAMNIRLVSVRDADGDEIDPDSQMENEIRNQALAFIGDA